MDYIRVPNFSFLLTTFWLEYLNVLNSYAKRTTLGLIGNHCKNLFWEVEGFYWLCWGRISSRVPQEFIYHLLKWSFCSLHGNDSWLNKFFRYMKFDVIQYLDNPNVCFTTVKNFSGELPFEILSIWPRELAWATKHACVNDIPLTKVYYVTDFKIHWWCLPKEGRIQQRTPIAKV